MQKKKGSLKRSYDHLATTQLCQAVRTDNAAAARRALAAGANPNHRGPYGALNQTSLVDDALEQKHYAVLHVLLEAGARVVPPRNNAPTTIALSSGTAIHAAARSLDLDAMRLFEKHRKAGPMSPLDDSHLPPLAHALRGHSARFLSEPRPEALDSALMTHWLSSPKALRDTAPGAATFAVLDACVGQHPVAFLDRLLSAGLDPSVCAKGPSPFVNAIDRHLGRGVPEAHAQTVRIQVEEWTAALARLGLPWPRDLDERPEAGALRAVYDAALLEEGLDAAPSRSSGRRRVRL